MISRAPARQGGPKQAVQQLLLIARGGGMDMDSNIVQVCVGVNVLSAYRELQTRRAWHTWAMHHSIVWVIFVLPSPPFFCLPHTVYRGLSSE